jgi:hypothetical protein
MPFQHYKSKVSALPLQKRKVDPQHRKGFQQTHFLVKAEVQTISKA